jgi:hypothetical protein
MLSRSVLLYRLVTLLYYYHAVKFRIAWVVRDEQETFLLGETSRKDFVARCMRYDLNPKSGAIRRAASGGVSAFLR